MHLWPASRLLPRPPRPPRLALRATAALLALAATAPVAAQDVAELIRHEGTLSVRGEMLPGDGARALALLDDSVRRVAVDSLGGDFDAWLDLAEAVRARGLAVAVRGACASACAQFLLPAAAALEIAPGSAVALHAAAHGGWREALARGRLDAPAFAGARAAVAPLQARIDAHARATGLDPAALDFLYALTSMRDVRAVAEPIGPTQTAVHLQGRHPPRCTGWLADGPALRALGVRTAPDYPMPADAEAAARLNVPPGSLYRGLPLPPAALARSRTCADVNRQGRLRVTR
jgi:hypothetical protein